MKLVLLGLPGAGKGTQASKLSDTYDIPHVSMGDILRNNKDFEASDGRTVGEIIDGGDPVPVQTTKKLLEQRLGQADAQNGWVLDGFPRWEEQAEAMDDIADVDAILILDITEMEVLERLTKRRICEDCGSSFHLKFKPPAVEGVCDRCGGDLYQREDDKAEAISERVEWQRDGLEEVVDHYDGTGLIERVDGSQPIDDVWDDVQDVAEKYAG